MTRSDPGASVATIFVNDPDADLLVRLRAGDEPAFAELVDRWSPAMLRIARGYVASRQSAEDVVQETWLAVVRGLDRFEGRSTLRTWVFKILINQARRRGSTEARTLPWSQFTPQEPSVPTVDPDRFQDGEHNHPGHWTSTGAPRSWDGPEGRLIAGEALSMLAKALDALPPRQRLVVALRDVHQLSSEEACAVLGITSQNQRVLLHRGRAALRAALEDYYRG
jgi:RNA polymerase sigma-70 factor, ECF subfamily